jgi:NDP-sugar pyrophosphorylase family protein
MSINYGSNSVTTTNKITSAAIDIADGYNTLYYYSGGDGNWTTAANWYLDYDHTIPAGRIPTINDIAVILNGITNSSGSIEAKEIIVRDNGYLNYATDIYSDVKFFDGTYISAGSIIGNASFYDSSYINSGGNSSSPVVAGHTNFYNDSYISSSSSSSYFGLSVTFNDDSHPYSGGSVYCQEININGSYSCAGSYYGNVNITSGYGISIGSSTFAIYDGILTIYKNNLINGSSVQLYNSSLILIIH